MADPVQDFLAKEQEDMAALGLDDSAPVPATTEAAEVKAEVKTEAEEPALSLADSQDSLPVTTPKTESGLGTPAESVEGLGGGLSESVGGLSNGHSANGLGEGVGNGLSGSSEPLSGASSMAGMPSVPREEPETIRKWKVEFASRLEAKDSAEREAIAALKAEAAKQLADFHAQRSEGHAKKASENRKAEEEFCALRDSTDGGKEWERIARMCEFNPKHSKVARDVSRMRALLLQKKAEKA